MIRKALKKDIDDINKLGLLFNDNFLNSYDINSYLENDRYIILINEDDYINGLLIAYNNIDYIELEGISVLESYRRKGIASELLNFLIDNYSKRILLEVKENNESAINLYKKYDFKIINKREKYYNDIDAYIMEREV